MTDTTNDSRTYKPLPKLTVTMQPLDAPPVKIRRIDEGGSEHDQKTLLGTVFVHLQVGDDLESFRCIYCAHSDEASADHNLKCRIGKRSGLTANRGGRTSAPSDICVAAFREVAEV